MRRIVLPKDLDVVIASFGGVGTSFLLSYLARYKKTNSPVDLDGFKHSPFPPLSINGEIKFVYIYGDPILAVASLFRRKYHHPHSKKLQRWRGHSADPIPKEMTLQEYTSKGVDRFYLREHFYNWYSKNTSVPTLFVRYETLFDNIGFLLDFLGIPEDAIDDFPKKKERSSNLSEIDPETRGQLEVMYSDFTRELSQLNDIEIRHADKRRVLSTTYLSPPYIRALIDHAKLIIKGCMKDYTHNLCTMFKKIW